MVSKLIAGIVVVVALAAAGTVGVAYYNDPTIFDSSNGSTGCTMQKSTEPVTQPTSHTEGSCCDSATQEKSCCESKP